MHTLLNRFFELALHDVHRMKAPSTSFWVMVYGITGHLSRMRIMRDVALAALALKRSLTEAHLGKPYGEACQFRMGLDSGLVVVGSIGDNLRMDYSAIGDTTNLAARLAAS